MAIPLLAGIPVLGSVITGLFTGLVGFFAQIMTKRLALVLLAVASLAGMTGAFYLAIDEAIDLIAVQLPVEVVEAAGLVCPPEAPAIVAAVASAHVVRWIYDKQVQILGWKVGAL